MLNTKRMRFPADVILVCILWHAAYPLSYRHLEEMMQEREVEVDHSSINRWVIQFLPLLERAFRNYKHAVDKSWRMDETYIKVKGAWKYLYCAVDKQGKTIDFLLTARRDASAAKRFFDKAMRCSSVPGTVTMDKSGANKAACDQLNAEQTSQSRSGKSSISTIFSSRIIVRSNASPDRCSDSNRSEQRGLRWPALISCI